jgi:probable rRNA maturation factor
MPATGEISISNRQRARRIDQRFFEKILRWLADEALSLDHIEVGFHLVNAIEMARVHEEFMGISGSTDVVTFDHGSEPPRRIHGEIFISVDDAIAQARAFKTTWQCEVVRYAIHGVLHLLGFDDLKADARAKMKREENRFLRAAAKAFSLSKLEKR